MNRILLTGTALLTLINAGMPASAAPRHARRYDQAPIERQWFGSGARVEGVYNNSPAERAGLRPGDVIVGINGSPINDHSDVDPFVAGGGGRPITIHVERGGTIVRLRATPRHGMLGYSYWSSGVCGNACDTPYVEPPVPPPIPPDPAQTLPPFIPPNPN
jgi:membrane-associated protease RseP (regulator of RpoE activity)